MATSLHSHTMCRTPCTPRQWEGTHRHWMPHWMDPSAATRAQPTPAVGVQHMQVATMNLPACMPLATPAAWPLPLPAWVTAVGLCGARAQACVGPVLRRVRGVRGLQVPAPGGEGGALCLAGMAERIVFEHRNSGRGFVVARAPEEQCRAHKPHGKVPTPVLLCRRTEGQCSCTTQACFAAASTTGDIM